MIDFHTHILPNMDDGCKSAEESNQLLDILFNEGVKLVCLTSHFYPRQESIDEFLNRRNRSFELLKYTGNLEIRLGSEVHYYRGISNTDTIDKLCIEGTDLLLVELPFSCDISDSIINEIINLNNRFRVVLAHIERYGLDENTIVKLKNSGILLQTNTEYICNKKTSKMALYMLENGYIDVLGSDCHNLKDRMPNYKLAIDIISNKLGNEFMQHFVSKSYNIINYEKDSN